MEEHNKRQQSRLGNEPSRNDVNNIRDVTLKCYFHQLQFSEIRAPVFSSPSRVQPTGRIAEPAIGQSIGEQQHSLRVIMVQFRHDL